MRTRTLQMILLCICAGISAAQDQSGNSEQPLAPEVTLRAAINVQDEDPAYAIELYSEVVNMSLGGEGQALAAYNRGVLQMGRDELDQAAESFRIAGESGIDSNLRRDSMFNLGHALMRGVEDGGKDLMAQMAMDPEMIGELLGKLGTAERAFLDSARIDPGHLESKKNLERVRLKIRELEQLKEQIEQQQQEQQDQENQDGEEGEDGEQQDMADQLQDLADQQREQAQESESAAQQNQDPNQQERSEEQEDLSEQTEQAQQQMENSEGQDQEQQDAQQQAQQDIEQARQAQEAAEEALERGDNQTASEKQQEAADALDRAAQRIRESQQQEEPQEGEGQASQPQEQGDPSQEPEIDEVAQQLLDKERDERERRQAYRATGQPVRVEEDW